MNGHAGPNDATGRPGPAAPNSDAGDPDTGEPPLLAHLDRLMEELHSQAPRALDDWDEDGIHRARVATRRLSAALELVKPVVGKKRRRELARVLRKLRRRLGPLRDADVMLGHLHELGPRAAAHGGAVEWLAAHVARERDEMREAAARKGRAALVLADLGAWHPVREQVAKAGATVDTLLGRSLHLQLDAFAEQAECVARPAPASESHDPHEVRIAGKALRYTLEMAVAQGHGVPSSVMKTFKRMQESLGAWHDFVVLTDKAMRASVDGLLSHRDAATQEQVLNLARLTLRRSARELARFAKVWSAKGGKLAAAVRAAFPLTTPPADAGAHPPVSGSQTDPGPPGSAETAAPEASPPDAPSAAS